MQKEIFVNIRNIGKDAEEKMFNATNNVNAYKVEREPVAIDFLNEEDDTL